MFLNCHSYHSLRYGTLSIDALVQQAYESGTKELVLTDINTVTGIYEFKKKCEKYGIKPIAGVEVRKGNKLLYIAVAKAFSGIGEINREARSLRREGKEVDHDAQTEIAGVHAIRHAERPFGHAGKVARDPFPFCPALIPTFALQHGFHRQMRGAGT